MMTICQDHLFQMLQTPWQKKNQYASPLMIVNKHHLMFSPWCGQWLEELHLLSLPQKSTSPLHFHPCFLLVLQNFFDSIIIWYYFKHLMIYGDGCFARHACFWSFALNTEMRWYAIQTGRLDVLHDMIGREGSSFTNHVLHCGINLCGTKQYWYRQWSIVILMVDTLCLPTIFFTHSAADLQWPELAHLICFQNKSCQGIIWLATGWGLSGNIVVVPLMCMG